MSSETSVHKTAQEGFSEGSFYDKNRPSYSDELVDQVIQSLHLGAEQDCAYEILELGAGTGKFTRKLLTTLSKPVRYLATEPSEGFLETFKQLSPDVEAKQCDATSIPLPDNSVQNIICAQAFHWFATVESLNEMKRVLVPGGRICFVWNNKDYTVEWLKRMEGILTQYYDNTPRAVTRKWKSVLENYDGLEFVEYKFLPGVQNMKGSKDFVIHHFSSISVIARLDEQEKKIAMDSFKAVLDQYFDDKEEIQIPFESEFYCVEKRS